MFRQIASTKIRPLSTTASDQLHSVGSIFSQACLKNSTQTALIACHQKIRLDYGRLSSLTFAFASALHGLKYKLGDRIALSLKNDSENLIAQLGCSLIGVAVVTAKDQDLLRKAAAGLGCRGAIVDEASSSTLVGGPLIANPSHPSIVTGRCQGLAIPHLSFDELLKSPLADLPSEISPDTPFAYYGTISKAVNHSDLIKAAQIVLMELRLGSWDRLCLPVTLNHSFGFGSGFSIALFSFLTV